MKTTDVEVTVREIRYSPESGLIFVHFNATDGSDLPALALWPREATVDRIEKQMAEHRNRLAQTKAIKQQVSELESAFQVKGPEQRAVMDGEQDENESRRTPAIV